MQQITVKDVMTRSPIAVTAAATIEQVLDTLVTQGVPSVYITNAENRLAGVVTDYEVLKLQVLGGDRTQTAETLMSRSVPTVRPEESALALCSQFRDGRLARMAVVDDDGRLIGNLSRCDLMRMMLTLEHLERVDADTASGVNNARCDAGGQVPSARSVQMTRKSPASTCSAPSSFDAALSSR